MLEYIVDSLPPEEEISDEDREALRQALEEHRKRRNHTIKRSAKTTTKIIIYNIELLEPSNP